VRTEDEASQYREKKDLACLFWHVKKAHHPHPLKSSNKRK